MINILNLNSQSEDAQRDVVFVKVILEKQLKVLFLYMILPLDLDSSYSRLVDIWFWSFVDSQVVFWHFKKQMFVPMHSSIVWPKHAIPI